jgi:predicted ATPase/class 3 adenylate cyclase
MSIVISGYQVKETLNTGERTVIYRGVRELDQQPVILKVLKEQYPSPKRIAWFKREYELLRRLNLDGVVKAHDFLVYQNRLVITLEDFDGQSLSHLIKLRPLRMTEFLPVAIKIVETLGEIHQRQIIHKDLNPANIVFNPKTGIVKLIDFGISTDLSREQAALNLSKELKGTLAYISPEQTGRMNRIVDYRSDFYSLGATFYELLTEQLPFPTNDTMELVHAHIAKPPQPLYERKLSVPQPLSDIVLKLMAKNAEDRYQSVFGLKKDLVECWDQWRATGRIDSFIIGQTDVSSRFQMPQKLYGREPEIGMLLAAFDRVCAPTGGAEMILVAGYSGIGKTVLVQEVHKPMTKQRGYFIAGKFDQLQRDIPYASLTQAFQSLIRQLLTESEEEIVVWKHKLLNALGTNAQVIIDVIPDLQRIIGAQPAVPQLGPVESQNRFNLTFQNFIQIFTRPEHPLILFVDDLQWTDTASLKLLQQLVTSLKNQTLFVIGAYRDNEVWEAHPLMVTLADIKKGGGIVNTITLAPLDLPTVNQIVADAVHTSLEKAQPLTNLVYAKTQGNPFFFSEFLKSLSDEGLLTFDVHLGTWQWDLAQIEKQDFTDNVVDLMTNKVQRLPAATQQVLKLAACIGNQFDLQTLAIVNQKSLQETASDLWQGLFEGLILPLDEDYKVFSVDLQGLGDLEDLTANYRFAHDRVQQAVYSLIPDDHKQKVHLDVGQLLLKDATQKNQREQRIFDIVRQLNEGQKLLTQQREQEELAELNLLAGKKAKASAAFKPAYLYLQTGVNLLGPAGWQRRYHQALELHEEAAETAYLSGDFDTMEQLKETVLKKATDKMHKVRVYQIKVQAEIAKNQPVVGINAAREALALFGIDIPAKPTPAEANEALAQTKARWEQRGIDDLVNLPKMTDPAQLAVARLLQKLYFVSYVVDPLLYQVVVSKLVSLSIDYGNDPPSSPEGYIQYALILCGLGDIENGYKSGKLAEQLVQNFGKEAITSAATVGCIFNGAVRVWVEHLRETRQPLLEAYQIGMNTGNLMFATLCLSFYANHLYWLGLELAEVEREIAKYNEVLHNLKQEMFIDILDVYQQSALNLMGKAATETPHLFVGNIYNEGDDTGGRRKIHLDTNNYYSLAHLYLNKVVMSYLFEQNTLAVEHAHTCGKTGKNYIGNVQGQGSVPVFNFYDSLAKLAVYHTVPKEEQSQILAQVAANQVQMKMWADHAPANYRHKYELVDAEVSRVSGQDWETRDKYDEAITHAVANEYLQDEALANELAAKFYLRKSNPQKHVARHYLRDAVYAYVRWGATVKAQQLEKQYPDLLSQTTMMAMIPGTFSTFMTTLTTRTHHGGGFGALDFMSVLKASQALSGNIVLDKLLSDLMRIIIENAGAEEGCLILERRGQWCIEAAGKIGKEGATVTVLQSIPISPNQLPMGIIHYVLNTQDSVVLNDAGKEGDFIKDPYIVQRHPQSVLCFPLLNQGKLQGILYLEHHLTTGAFTPDRIQVLSLLSTQAAISIENASLYGHQIELKDSYSRFVPPEYLKFLRKEGIMDVHLGDHVAKEMAVMFSDIRSFTTLSEDMTAQENFDFINAYLKRVSPPIRDNNGLIVKYLGDGIMAIFPNGADDALRASVTKLKQVEEYNIQRQREGRQAIKIGIGIHIGHMMVGMVGEVARMQGDAFSDNVNLTSRIEGLTKFYGAALLISEEALNRMEDPSRYQIRFLDRVVVKGRSEPISVYEVLDGEPESVMNLKLATQANFEKGMRRYQAKNFEEAEHFFNEVLQVHPGDKAALLYVERVSRFRKEGVPEGWDGVTVLTEK